MEKLSPQLFPVFLTRNLSSFPIFDSFNESSETEHVDSGNVESEFFESGKSENFESLIISESEMNQDYLANYENNYTNVSSHLITLLMDASNYNSTSDYFQDLSQSAQSYLQNINHDQGNNSDTDVSGNNQGIILDYSNVNWFILLLGVLVLVGVLGNSLVCLAICYERRLQNATNYFLLSLAIADLLVSIIVMPISILYEFYGEF